MKRNARRAVLFACFALGAGWLEAQPAGAGDVCAKAGLWSDASGPCVPTPVGTTQCAGTGNPVLGILDVEACVPVP